MMQLLMTFGASTSAFCSILAILPQPYPLFITSGLILFALTMSMLLPEGGSFLPKAVKLSESITIMDFEPLQFNLQESIMMGGNVHTTTFHDTFREKQLGV